ncbi:phage terminase large subunit family protein, partial [Thermus sp.]
MKPEAAYRAILEALRLPPPEFAPEELTSLLRFVEASGIRPEGPGGAPFSLEGRRYLAPLYAEDRARPFRRLVIMKAAQMGLTTRLMYRAAWWAADARRKVDVALYFPTQDAVLDLHKTRFRPMMRSSARMMRLIADVDAVEVVRVGASNIRFRGMRSGVSVDSIPVDVLLFDEVRLMDLATLERAFARVSASRLVGPHGERGLIELNSTAGFPGADIDYYFGRSTQNHWHTRCPNTRCPNHKGFVMAFAWPECVDPERMAYRCPKCGAVIEDPQDGFYAPLGPKDAEWEGYAFNQILLGPSRLPELWRAYQRMVVEGKNPSEFYNAYLGLPHRDPNAILVPGEVMDRCRGLDPTH